MAYVSDSAETTTACFLCTAATGVDENVVAEGSEALAILNKFPYNTGHVMIASKRHVADLAELTDSERTELWDMVTRVVAAVTKAMKPDGFNVGLNLGTAAGAGVPGHLHVHVVPRWGGDTNFMTTIGETKVLPEMLAETRAKLAPLL